MKKSLLKVLLTASLCAMLIGTTGCSALTDAISSKDDDSKIEQETEQTETKEDDNEVNGYTSSKDVIIAFWESMEAIDEELMTTCFYEKADNVEEDINSNMENAEIVADYTVFHLDDIKIEDNDEDAESIVKDLNYKGYDAVEHFTVSVPMTQTMDDTIYEVEDIYNIVTVCYDDCWYIVRMEEIDVIITDSSEVTTPSNKNDDVDGKRPTNEKDSENIDIPNTNDDVNLPVSGEFSDIYADPDNRCFMINGIMYTLGENVLQDLIDDGVIFEDISNANNNIKPNYESERFTILLNDEEYYYCNVQVSNFTDENKTIAECPITSIDIYCESNIDFVENTIEFAFPLNITEEDLRDNSGEPTEFDEYISDTSDYISHTLEYEWEGTKYIGSSGYSFEFVNGELYNVSINYEP